MVNVSKLSAFFASADYWLKSVSYKPTPGSLSVASLYALNSTSQGYFEQRSKSKKHRKPVKVLDTSSEACQVKPYDPPPILDQIFPPFDLDSASVYRYRQQRSVNLGSWFVHEKWMTPSLFQCASGSQASEIDIASGWGSGENAKAVLERHWDTFIQESDFQYLANIGINTVRLPIGYWNLGPNFMDGTAFESVAKVYEKSWSRVVRAINQAGKAGLGVLVDLHGAPGSQNGQQHSGISDGQTTLFSVPANMDKTIDMLKFLAQQLSGVNNIVGIQLLNEPQYDPDLEDFYTRAIDAMRATSQEADKLPLYLHDAFDLGRFSNYVAARKDFVVQDHHSYFVFTPSDQNETAADHIADVDGAISQQLTEVSQKQGGRLIIGEWSCALTPDSLESESNSAEVRKEFCEEQMKVYARTTAGWSFWSYKKENCDDDPGWCFTGAVGKSLPSTFFTIEQPTSPPKRRAIPRVSNLDDGRRDSPHSGIFKPHIHHRFETIHRQRGVQGLENKIFSILGSTSKSNTKPSFAAQQSKLTGYAAGLKTAKVFASHNSKLGFVEQYQKDSIQAAGPAVVVPGTEVHYNEGFMQGLGEIENKAGS